MSRVSPQAARIFDIVGSYAVDLVFNHLYASAVNHESLATRTNTSIADIYRKIVQTFAYSLKQDNSTYSGVIKGIFTFYQSHSRVSISFDDFINMLISLFVPEDYIRQFTKPQKDQILMKVIIALFDRLTMVITSARMLDLIITNHAQYSKTTVASLQDQASNILIYERDNMFNMFVTESSNNDPQKDMFLKNKETFKTLQRANRALTHECDSLKRVNESIKKTLRQVMLRAVELEKRLSAAQPPATMQFVDNERRVDRVGRAGKQRAINTATFASSKAPVPVRQAADSDVLSASDSASDGAFEMTTGQAGGSTDNNQLLTADDTPDGAYG